MAIRPGATFGFEQPRPLFATAVFVPGRAVPTHDVSPDGRRFVMLRPLHAREGTRARR